MCKPICLLLILCFSTVQSLSQNIVTPENVNSAYDEQNPILDTENGILYFTRSKHPENEGGRFDEGDIWFSVKQSTGWSFPENARGLNNSAWNSVVGLTSKGDLILYGHYQDGKPAKTQGLSIALKRKGSFGKPENIDIPYFRNTSKIFGGSISENGEVLALSMESYDSKGTEDIYVSLKKGGRWSEPRNLGDDINSRFQEFSPYINRTLDTLYFSSNGHGGRGSADVFMSVRLDDSWMRWSEPQALDAINTTGKETGYRKYPGFSLFTSTLNSDGFGDIKFHIDNLNDSTFTHLEQQDSVDLVSLIEVSREDIAMNSNFFTLYGNVKDQKSGSIITATLHVSIKENDFEKSVVTDQPGRRYSLSIPSAGIYKIKVTAPNYIAHQEELEVFSAELKLLQKDFALQEIEVGARVNLDNVLFEQSKSIIIPSSYEQLNLVVALLRENPSIKIRLEGHTDNRGDAKQNLKLSKERVEAVKTYLVKRGVAKKRVSGKGFGGSKPIADNSKLETRKLNRRVEFIILKD
ncbi:MAG: OmpA family protein [Fulvivirga sp.]